MSAENNFKTKLGKLSSVKNRGQTDRVTALPRPYALDIDLWKPGVNKPMTLAFNPMTQTHKTQVQRSAGSKDKVETNGRTDTTNCILSC